jgi:hypothetical protein
MGIIKKYHDKKWTLQFLDALYNSIDIIDKLIIQDSTLLIIILLLIYRDIYDFISIKLLINSL